VALSGLFPGGEVDVVVDVGTGVGSSGGRVLDVVVVVELHPGMVVDGAEEQHSFTVSCTAGEDDWPT
jgi:hypothetical protein